MSTWSDIETRLTPLTAEELPAPEADEPTMQVWLQEQPVGLEFLLAHTYDGVVWGRRVKGQWRLSSELGQPYPQLVASMLQTLHVFGVDEELFLWRGEDGRLCGRVFQENSFPSDDVEDETQILWGNLAQPRGDVFSELQDGRQGLIHAVPLTIHKDGGKDRPAQLIVRHYIVRDPATGLALKWFSRLVTLQVNSKEA
jgi:CRISPR-associated protein (TIGR03984 family)